MKKYIYFIKNILNENKKTKIVKLKYYAFDWDDNILYMPTKIYLEKYDEETKQWNEIAVSTKEFAELRKNTKYKITNNSFRDFTDDNKDNKNIFLTDVKYALKNKMYGPSWNDFKKCLIGGHLFAIITARAHSSKTLQTVIKYIINTELSQEEKIEMGANLNAYNYLFDEEYDYMKDISFEDLVDAYLENCYFACVNSTEFKKQNNINNNETIEKSKILALENFINKINKYITQLKRKSYEVYAKLGFSDDDKINIKNILLFFNEHSMLGDIHFYTFQK